MNIEQANECRRQIDKHTELIDEDIATMRELKDTRSDLRHEIARIDKMIRSCNDRIGTNYKAIDTLLDQETEFLNAERSKENG